MNADQLLAHYEKIADAPDATLRLRCFILDLAVRGKLVAQDPADEPASELLERIATERAQVDQSDLPKGWVRAKVGAVLDFKYGKGLKASERFDEGPVSVFGSNGIVGYYDVSLTTVPSIIIGRKGSAGALNFSNEPSWTTDVAYYVETPATFKIRFLLFILQTLDLEKLGKGVKPGLSRSDAYELLICVPPLAEQHRIVAKVDELMALCDRLKAARAERETTRDRLAAASLARLNAPDSNPAAFQNHATFALDNLAPLTTRPDQIKALRQTILNLAVRGKLVEQDSADEPASELLKRIEVEKERLVKAKEIRIRNPKKPVYEVDEAPYDLPSSWCWSRLRQITSDRGQTIPDALFTYIDVTSIDNKNGIVTDPKVLEANLAPSRARKIIRKDDVIYSCVRPYLLNVAVIDHKYDPSPIASTAFAVFNGHGLVLPRYLWIVLRSSFMIECVEVKMRGQAYPAINDADFSVLPIPLPPFAEQHRIVVKVDELVALCDRLEASLTSVDTTLPSLFDALLHEALEPTADRETAA